MVEHIVLFKMKPQSTPAEKEELIRRLRGLAGKIDGIVDLSAGETLPTGTRAIPSASSCALRIKRRWNVTAPIPSMYP